MKKYTFLFVIYFLASGFIISGSRLITESICITNIQLPVPSYHLIIPGVSIGLSSINKKATQVYKSLGVPKTDEGAMGGKSLATWVAKPIVLSGVTIVYETNIYFTTADFGMKNAAARVNSIRITSPSFVTTGQIGTGKTLIEIRKAFPRISKLASYHYPDTREEILIYDDTNAGISFEINSNQTCIGITVHKPRLEFLEIYNGLFSDVQR